VKIGKEDRLLSLQMSDSGIPNLQNIPLELLTN